MSKEDFYVGYSDDQPKSVGNFLKPWVIGLGVIVAVAAACFSIGQNKFKNSTFELGKKTQITGVLDYYPYPVLRVETGEGIAKDVLLLGFGKFGAFVGSSKMANGKIKDGAILKLEGTLIYYNGKTLFQLETNWEETYEVVRYSDEFQGSRDIGEVTFSGEIVDPKCFFGVMKPGRGKIHRSCAVRCISGGIPPVLVSNEKGTETYYLLTDRNGEPINQQVLDYIGKPCTISGNLVEVGDWMHLQIDPKTIKLLDRVSAFY
ncbi:MAG: hypothetical protein JJ975_06190 [Bacteroidia bacterium]|nr:hypothetical protein [Bacteroidia bacterium]